MQRNTLVSILLAAVLAGSVPVTALAGAPHSDGHGKHAMRGIAKDVFRNATEEERAVLKDLRRIDSLYRRAGLASELPALYADVLARTQNASVTTLVNARLQQLQAPKPDTAETIAALRQRLDENLAILK